MAEITSLEKLELELVRNICDVEERLKEATDKEYIQYLIGLRTAYRVTVNKIVEVKYTWK
jgi:predicted transcriptional regulator